LNIAKTQQFAGFCWAAMISRGFWDFGGVFTKKARCGRQKASLVANKPFAVSSHVG
jgi:hypothetical protein